MLSMTGASPRSAATRAPSMVADITRRRRSSRKAICTSRASAKPRSASSERSWNSSNSTAATPSSVGSSRMSRVKMPSVTTSIRVLRETLDPNRIRRPTSRRRVRRASAPCAPLRRERQAGAAPGPESGALSPMPLGQGRAVRVLSCRRPAAQPARLRFGRAVGPSSSARQRRSEAGLESSNLQRPFCTGCDYGFRIAASRLPE